MRLLSTPTAALALLLMGTSMADAATCRDVRGALAEKQVTGTDCASPVGFCTVALVLGHVRGQATFTASDILEPLPEVPSTGVVFVIGDTVLNALFEGKGGTFLIKNAAAFRTTGDGDLVDVQVIVGGTGAFAGASGSLRVTGTFVNGAGSATYEGTVCVP